MSEMRDRCWIKALKTGETGSYCLPEEKTAVAKTIREDMPLLFQNIKEAPASEAALVFEKVSGGLGEEGYRIEKKDGGYRVSAETEQGWLYGMFGLNRILGSGKTAELPVTEIPEQKLRMIDHWDNFDGSIERGYAGESIFYRDNEFRKDYGLVREYARLLASVGVNALSINNVNVHRLETRFLEEDNLLEIKKLADIFRAYGIQVYLCINFAAPISVGGLSTGDPLDPEVAAWWKNAFRRVYDIIPDFGGVLVKADSEGGAGPFSYGRDHKDGANMLARAIKDFGGTVIWRCFVYNCTQKYWQREIDRARAACDIFSDLDGKFEENVILQIKNGPIDFQIREPISPLFGRLKHTRQVLEVQITQEYTGHQKDLCYLIPMWKEALDFDLKCEGEGVIKNRISGIAGVGNVGMDSNWTGNKLAQANLYGFGRLCWKNGLTSGEIAEEWIALSMDLSETNAKALERMLLTSREVYEEYTCPLSVGFMCKPGNHYGVDIDGYEYDRWGTYHYADRDGVGRDRTVASGTGYTRLYSDARYEEYESLETCPDELLLFLHHVPYTHVLHSGKTVIQHIYDSHFQGVEKVEEYLEGWKSMKAEVDEATYKNVEERLLLQVENAQNWRDQINTYFYRKSGIDDEKGREIYK